MLTPSTPAPSINLGYAPAALNRRAIVYCWLCALSATCLVIADLVGIRLFRIPLPFSFSPPWDSTVTISAIEHSCGMFVFPVTFILTDLLNEYYGKRAARRAVLISFSMGLFVALVIIGVSKLPRWDAPFNVDERAFQTIFRNALVMYMASLTAYLIGNFADIALFAFIKRLTGGKRVWLRATGSTLCSQFIDSLVITYLAFSLFRHWFPSPDLLPMKLHEVLPAALTGYMLKFFIAIASTPIIYAGRSIMKQVFGLHPLPPE